MSGPHLDVSREDIAGGIAWSIEDIPYRSIARDEVRDDRRLFYILAAASFIEITSDLYTRNLVEFFRHDSEVAGWLERVWVREELQHGAALKRYVETAWPDFDWEGAYRSFVSDYGQLCTSDRLASTRALEMAARCVVETGTASFYRMISAQSREPVLRMLAAKISADEVRHYKHFYRYFQRFQAVERPSRAAVLRTLWNRTTDIDAEDAFYSFRAIHLALSGDTELDKADYDAYRDGVRQLARRHFPVGMSVKMLLKPLGLNALVSRAVLPVVTSATRFLLLRHPESS